jgi:hypothetical protein
MKPRVRAQLHSSSARSSKILKDDTQIETVVEVDGVGRLVLDVDSKGGYSLRAYPEGSEDPKEPHAPREVPMCEATILPSTLIPPSAWKGFLRSLPDHALKYVWEAGE